MTRIVGLVLADRARRSALHELAIGRRRAGEARRILMELAEELAAGRARRAIASVESGTRRPAAELGHGDPNRSGDRVHRANG